MNVVTRERTRTCVRCHERFTEPAGTVTRVCGDCSCGAGGVDSSGAGGVDVDGVGEAERDSGRDSGRDASRESGTARGTAGGTVDQSRERACLRCDEAFLEGPGEVARLCPSCDPDRVQHRDR